VTTSEAAAPDGPAAQTGVSDATTDTGAVDGGALEASVADDAAEAAAASDGAASNEASDDSDAGTGGSDASTAADGDASPTSDAAPSTDAASGEGGATNPSCNGLTANCGPNHDESCCASSLVTGGTFQRDNGVNGNYPAAVSSFRLDRFEITVGRFRKFYAQYPSDQPAGSSGINSNVSADPGWDPVWNGTGYLESTASALNTAVQCTNPSWQNWTVGDDTLPMNCISWYEAYAFCIWDGGRLPTELEWNYAAAGGSDQRPYPWSTSPTDQTIDSTYAVIAPYAAVYAPVGSDSPKGDGRWGQADLAGNVMEWTEDWRAAYPATCTDCADVDWTQGNQVTAYSYRQVRGGSAGDDAYFQLTSTRWYWNVPSFRTDVIGARCARNP
jgi:formylglycine-generating enzyme required for sulfatase activity